MSEWINDSKNVKNTAFALSLLSAFINGKKPVEPDFDADWEFIYKFSKLHNVDNTIFYPIEQLKNKPEASLYKEWMDIRNKCIHRNIIQRQEFSTVCSAFEKAGIEYMPVKGFYISGMYPTEDSRYMSDLDILIKDRRDEAARILLDMGYTFKKNGVDYDKPLLKPPFMVVELHNSLFPMYTRYRSCFEDVFSKSSRNNNCYTMSPEDFYVYEAAHFFKHYSGSGVGVRSVIDFYLINKNILPEIDRSKTDSRLKKLGLYEMSKEIEAVTKKWFEEEDYSSFSDTEIYILSSGTYGTKEKMVKNKLKGKSKSGYILFRLFPSKDIMIENFPVLKKHPYLFPIFYIFRLFKGLFTKRKNIKTEYELLKSNNVKDR